jgi:uncharacterized protein (DUF58 family)
MQHLLYSEVFLEGLRAHREALSKTLIDGGFPVHSLENLILELDSAIKEIQNGTNDSQG